AQKWPLRWRRQSRRSRPGCPHLGRTEIEGFFRPYRRFKAAAAGCPVKQVTSCRFLLRHGRQEPVGGIGIGKGVLCVCREKDRRWTSCHSCGEPEEVRPSGCRCWSRPWRGFLHPSGGTCAVMRWSWRRCAPSLHDLRRLTRCFLLASV